jgi:hypothetical protein
MLCALSPSLYRERNSRDGFRNVKGAVSGMVLLTGAVPIETAAVQEGDFCHKQQL